jgi:hypothetical protein
MLFAENFTLNRQCVGSGKVTTYCWLHGIRQTIPWITRPE